MKIDLYNASAGSGKTFRLTQILKSYISGEGDRTIEGKSLAPGRLIATTFTREAAADLKKRVRSALIQDGLLSQAEQLEGALIGTVHSVCGQLLNRYAIEDGRNPALQLMDENDAATLLKGIIGTFISHDYILRTKYFGIAFQDSDFSRDSSYLDYIEKWVSSFRSNDLSTPDKLAEQRLKLENHLLELYPDADFPQLPEGFDTSLQNLLNTLRSLRDTLENDSDVQEQKHGFNGTYTYLQSLKPLIRQLELEPRDWQSLKNISTTDKLKKAFKDEWEEQILSLHSPLIQSRDFRDDLIRFTLETFDIASAVLNEYQKQKSERGMLDFTDQESELLRMLQQREGIREEISRSFDLLMVDEFQDTSPIQLAIFSRLSQLLKKSIWVGDPKQSIYGFRDADAELMNRLIEKIPENTDKPLDTSWRSSKELVFLSNALFACLFSDLPPDKAVLKPCPHRRDDDRSIGPPLTLWEFSPASGKGKLSKALYAKALALKVSDLLSRPTEYLVLEKDEPYSLRPLRPGDVCILVRKGSEKEALASALIEKGLRVNAESSGLLQTFEIRLLSNLLSSTLNPDDKKARALVELYSHFQGNASDLLNYYTDNTSVEYTDPSPSTVLRHLDSLREQISSMPLTDILDLIIADLHLISQMQSLPDPQQRTANILHYRSLLQEYTEICRNRHRLPEFYDFSFWLTAKNRAKGPSQAFAESPDAVNILTYHGAKGREFPLVILSSLDATLKDDPSGISTIPAKNFDTDDPLKNRLVRCLIKPLSKYPDTLIDSSRKKTLEEEKRLFYVGLTRARDHLVLAFNQSQLLLPQSIGIKQLSTKSITDLPPGLIKDFLKLCPTPENLSNHPCTHSLYNHKTIPAFKETITYNPDTQSIHCNPPTLTRSTLSSSPPSSPQSPSYPPILTHSALSSSSPSSPQSPSHPPLPRFLNASKHSFSSLPETPTSTPGPAPTPLTQSLNFMLHPQSFTPVLINEAAYKSSRNQNEAGTCLHNIFYYLGSIQLSKLQSSHRDHALTVIQRTVQNFEMLDIFPQPSTFLDAHISLQTLLQTLFPHRHSFCEHPFLYIKNGQEMSGSIDLLLQTEKGFVILDYKTHFDRPEKLADFSTHKYSTQMLNYIQALSAAGPVSSACIIYPASGRLTLFETPDPKL